MQIHAPGEVSSVLGGGSKPRSDLLKISVACYTEVHGMRNVLHGGRPERGRGKRRRRRRRRRRRAETTPGGGGRAVPAGTSGQLCLSGVSPAHKRVSRIEKCCCFLLLFFVALFCCTFSADLESIQSLL